jgi:DNA-binding CsgD family transcriptional regulator
VNKPVKTREAGLSRRQAPGSALLDEHAWMEIARKLGLSGRELQIVCGVFDDRTEFAIAADLGISPHTVHTHTERLHRKLAVDDRVELVLRVMDAFLVLTTAPESTLPPICANWAANFCPLKSRLIRKQQIRPPTH